MADRTGPGKLGFQGADDLIDYIRMANESVPYNTTGKTNASADVRPPHPLISEQTPEETIARLRSLSERAGRLREKIDASRTTYSR